MMRLPANPRKLLIPLLLVLTLVAAIMAPSEQTISISLPEKQARAGRVDKASTDDVAMFQAQDRHLLADDPVDIFYQENQEEKAANEARQRQSREALMAPPLPFVYMGKQERNGHLSIFLTREDRPYVVEAGDVIDAQYKVDAVRPDAIQFTYLPLSQKQILNIGMNP